MIRKKRELKEASRTSCNGRIKFYVNLELHDVILPYSFSHGFEKPRVFLLKSS
jgi:hypothetical protein